ncbi:hypothetical protein RFI_06809 [Reticulomyxa filosa]|uniref:Uncharacterized protein n=1 Tax=Reticulomyxa filosa TaxID=46433 RepID=X6NVH1_RETFI|nr:hypothetical protein RFI_06809 [Reticulomyxa filosa]|eukprot:ETO30310.1 hypothetical protein RFI_06809 [Reticulomyxa filosa]
MFVTCILTKKVGARAAVMIGVQAMGIVGGTMVKHEPKKMVHICGSNWGSGNGSNDSNKTSSNNPNDAWNSSSAKGKLGTKHITFKAECTTQDKVRYYYQNICAQKQFASKSPEQLRFEDMFGVSPINPNASDGNGSGNGTWSSSSGSSNPSNDGWGNSSSWSGTDSSSGSSNNGWGTTAGVCVCMCDPFSRVK